MQNKLPVWTGNTHAWLKNGARGRIINSRELFIKKKTENCRISLNDHKVSWSHKNGTVCTPDIVSLNFKYYTYTFAAEILNLKFLLFDSRVDIGAKTVPISEVPHLQCMIRFGGRMVLVFWTTLSFIPATTLLCKQ